MKRIIYVMAGLLLLTASCSPVSGNDAGSLEAEKEDQAVKQEIKDEDLIYLIEKNMVIDKSGEVYVPLTDGKGFPLELVNKLARSVFEGNSDDVIQGLNDTSMEITEDELISGGDTNYEHTLVRGINDSNGPYYICDLDGDGIKEVLALDQDFPAGVRIYTNSGGIYVYSAYKTIGAVRNFAIFQYENNLYLAANCDNYILPKQIDVRLYRIDDGDFIADKQHNHVCFRRQTDIANLSLLYKNDGFSSIDALQEYADEIMYDLSVVARGYHPFYGSETERQDIQKQWAKQGLELGNLYEADVDNDETPELFERLEVWSLAGYGREEMATELYWYGKDMEEIPQPYVEWSDVSYEKKRVWFQQFDGKTVIFSLYHKMDSSDTYLLDARIHEDGRTTLLLDYAFHLRTSGIRQELSEQIPYSSSTAYLPADYQYKEPDFEKAFPGNLDESAYSLMEKNQGEVDLENKGNWAITADLIDRVKEISVNGGLGYEIESYTRRINKYGFKDRYEEMPEEIYGGDDGYVYEYVINDISYFLTLSGEYGLTSLNVYIYKEIDGKIDLYQEFFDLDVFTAVIYENELYLLEEHFEEGPESPWSFYIHKLAPEKEIGFAAAQISVLGYEWEKLYGGGPPYEHAVTGYISEIRDKLTANYIFNNREGAFTGDETTEIDPVKLQRLKSVSGEMNFYRIDFNNDGFSEYFSKTKEEYRSIFSNVYRFEDKTTSAMNYTIHNHRILDSKNYLAQIWFKEIGGKIFTFKLLYRNDYCILNVTLVEGTDITDVVSYVIVPKREVKMVTGDDVQKAAAKD